MGILRPATPRPRGRPRGSGRRAAAENPSVGTGVPVVPLAASDGAQRLQAKRSPIVFGRSIDVTPLCTDRTKGAVHTCQANEETRYLYQW